MYNRLEGVKHKRRTLPPGLNLTTMADFIGALIGGAMGMANSAINAGYQRELTEQDRRENYMYNEMAAGNADARTRALYNDFYSPGALLKQYQEAGLSPSLMFGGTPGQGGMSGAQGAGTSGIQTHYTPISFMEGIQAANIQAQTEKTKAETKTIEESRGATIKDILADAGLKEASIKVQAAEAAGIALDNYVKDNTKEASIYRICEEAEKAGYEAQTAYEKLRSAKVLAEIDEATLQEQIEISRKGVEQVAQAISESKSTVRLNEQQRRKIYNDILQAWEQLEINWKEQSVSQQQADTYTEWIEKQIPIIEKQLEAKFKELDIEKKRMVIDAVTGTLKSLAFGAMAAASFKGGQGSLQQPTPGTKLTKTTKSAYKNRGKNIYEANEIYGW